MGISRDKFDKGDFKTRCENINTHPVIAFLRKNHRNAFMVDEIAKSVKLNKSTIRGCLNNAVRKGIVEHKTPYYIAVVKHDRKSKK